ncbi:MAG: STAS/SEC14 domain-containing protein [Deltaproteobacteria bacterium]|nr:STAS/SEC14 domain-containing protein [Deltaproteobacteria bacterium]
MEYNAEVTLAEQEPDSLLLMIIRDARVDKRTLKLCIELAPKMRPFTKKTAVVGLPKMRQIFVNYLTTVSGMNVKAFTEEDEAREWLIK